jgi:AraC-like DNA-binding protein
MGLFVFRLNRLPAPFLKVEETIFEVPATRPLEMSNRGIRVIFILGGVAQLRLGNSPAIPLLAGDAFILSRPISYAYAPAFVGKSARLHALALSLRLESTRASLSHQVLSRFPECVHYSGIQSASILHYIHQLRSEAEESEVSPLAVSALASLLVLLVLRAKKNLPPQSRAVRSATFLIEQTKEYIHKNYRDPLTLEQIAWRIGLSEEYLSRLFKRETGQTVFEYVRETRFNIAKRLLIETNYSVARIAGMAGFSSPQVFCRVFRQTFSQSATAYRSAHGGVGSLSS